MKRLVIDIETRSIADLPKVGVAAYAQAAETAITHVGYHNGHTKIWRPSLNPMPADLADALADDRVKLVAHNVSFERNLLSSHAGRAIGFPPSIGELSRWDCTMARAAYIGLPRDLGGICRALSLPIQKDKEGHALMLRVCKPRTQSPLTWWEDEGRMSRMDAYCAQDVDAETLLDHELPHLSEAERRVWEATERLNDRGIRIDVLLLERLVTIADAAKRDLDTAIREATGKAVPKVSNHAALTRWLISQGLEVDGSSKDIVEELLLDDDLSSLVRTVLELRQVGNGSSPRKTAAMARQLVWGRIHGAIIYGGAPATLRWSSQGAQLQNLPRHDKTFDVEAILRDIEHDATVYELEDIHGPPLKVVSELLRPVLIAAPGKRFIIGDYAQIEARILAWFAGQLDRLEVFRRYDAGTGPDPYKITAVRIYHVPLDEITSGQRQIGKVADLALGYQGGARAFKSMAKSFGLKIPTNEAEEIKHAWRAAHPYIEQLWHQLEAAAKECVSQRPGEVFRVGRIELRRNNRAMTLQLPSGRRLVYWSPSLKQTETPWGELRYQLHYYGHNAVTRQWQEFAAYGGLLTENAVQATARDVLADALIRLDAAGLNPVLLVHDEAVCETDAANVDAVTTIMETFPAWTEDLPLAVKVVAAPRYVKGD